MKGSVKKDKKTGKYFYFVDIGIDLLTGKILMRYGKCIILVCYGATYLLKLAKRRVSN